MSRPRLPISRRARSSLPAHACRRAVRTSRLVPPNTNRYPRSYGVYLFFGALSFLSILFVWFLIPETKGIPLEYTDRLFSIKPIRNANSILQAELQREEQHFRRRVSTVVDDDGGAAAEKEHATFTEKASRPRHGNASDTSS